jgi:Leucine-rich repeat (LRR) protein
MCLDSLLAHLSHTFVDAHHVQNMTSLDGLAGCTTLVSLWICNTAITQISGLDNCIALTELVLYGNKISAIDDGVAMLSQLEHLDLHSNKLTTLTGLSKVNQLEILNVAVSSFVWPFHLTSPCLNAQLPAQLLFSLLRTAVLLFVD